MKLSTLEKIINIASQILYVVATKRTSLDRAFQEVVKGAYRDEYKKVPHGTLYRLCRCVLRDYFMVEHYLRKALKRSKIGMKTRIKAWIALKGYELFEDSIVMRIRKELNAPSLTVEDLIEMVENPIDKLAIKYSYPRWFVEELLKHFSIEECSSLLDSLNREVLWIRVNTLKVDVDKVVRLLEDRGMEVEIDGDLPYMVKVLRYESCDQYLDLVHRCEVVLQDKASALVVEELGVDGNVVILDLAAAPGVKTSLIMQLTENKARVIAMDVSRERISRMKKFLKCMGVDLTKVDIVLADSTRISLSRKVPKALLDAPCTGSGTIPRDPAIKLHLTNRAWLNQLTNVQFALLENALKLSNDVVYAVCSVLPNEGEEIIKHFSNYLITPKVKGSPGFGDVARYVIRLYPHIHGTHGFFISHLREF